MIEMMNLQSITFACIFSIKLIIVNWFRHHIKLKIYGTDKNEKYIKGILEEINVPFELQIYNVYQGKCY